MPELYSTVDALINYPERDGFPVHFLEAAVSKRPVISCRQPAYDWGFAAESFDFVQLGEVGELAGAMQRLINGSPESVTRLEYAFEAVSRKYDESVTAAALLDVYRHVTR